MQTVKVTGHVIEHHEWRGAQAQIKNQVRQEFSLYHFILYLSLERVMYAYGLLFSFSMRGRQEWVLLSIVSQPQRVTMTTRQEWTSSLGELPQLYFQLNVSNSHKVFPFWLELFNYVNIMVYVHVKLAKSICFQSKRHEVVIDTSVFSLSSNKGIYVVI